MDSVPRYITKIDLGAATTRNFDVLVIGSGVAGLFTALKAVKHGRVGVVTKEILAQGSTPYAQGGIAAAMCPQDSPAFHLEDTMVAGAGLCSRRAVSVLVTEGPERVRELIRLGAQFDMKDGRLVLGREGAHGVRRIAHAQGDATGREVERTLVARIEDSPVETLENVVITDLITRDGECCGAVGFEATTGAALILEAKATVLATGGAGQLYATTTNPPVCTGDGIAMAYRAGAVVCDLEFVQFHPTALAVEVFPKFLISEAVRGEGAFLLNEKAERFMPRYDDRAELAPRDIVTRAIWAETRKSETQQVHLDLTSHSRDAIRERFPTIYRTCLHYGIDPAVQPIPVYPTAHYLMGGVKTDLGARTNVPGLLACGEAACTGVHGANRLASNSMLEGLVFGARAAESAGELCGRSLPATGALPLLAEEAEPVADCRQRLRELMWEHVGIVRSAETLTRALGEIESLLGRQSPAPGDRQRVEQANMLLLSAIIARTALRREESRGAHYRDDFPGRDDTRWQGHLEVRVTCADESRSNMEPQMTFVEERDR